MKLFDRFSKKSATATMPALSPTGEKNFVDDLVTYFSSQPEITAAWFGFAYNNAVKQYQLFLAVDHDGEAEAISALTWTIKSAHMSDTDIQYASPTHSGDMLEYISQHNPPFYHKDNSALLQQKVMKQWFDVKKYKQELIDTLKASKVFALAYEYELPTDRFSFATYVRDTGEFLPLFSNQDMIAKSGISDIPKGRLAVQLPFEMISKMLAKEQFFILNPGTPFEVELRV
ncbi:enhanced serine sensitivity protein SseB C-terminal domain-containing protein [Chitinophaga filiformis]|uniref:enhanced serine sensitivity protein SseB C-terminal domain-containing protein n=1 Tax=Chitinophaga filiformis TaxID=104663 RepID=UPI001F39DD4B|nr:enhanced serine sensitivity protein SseB C-terminal domain-containing protein [Chitinophaga filiformis]MCF6405441.1 enhanced serine sensitivity protein SseB C-terminal domain-containing protein [Chitinophaga filiformis]